MRNLLMGSPGPFEKLFYWVLIICAWAAVLFLPCCTKTYIEPQCPFEYELTDTSLTVFMPLEGGILYYTAEIYPTGWGAYDWDPFNQGAWCRDSSGVKRILIDLDEREFIRLWTTEIDYITTIDKL